MDFKELAKAIAPDAWIINHFRILPTDERYKGLTERQKQLLYFCYMENPRSEDLYTVYDRGQSEFVIDDQEAKDLMSRGYTSEQIKYMREQLKNAGYH